MLPGEIFFLLSNGKFEFRNKAGVAEFLSERLSSHRADSREFSSVHVTVPRDKSVTKLSDVLNADLPDGLSRSSAKKKSNTFRQRTLSIAPSVERLSALPSVQGADVVSKRSDYLD